MTDARRAELQKAAEGWAGLAMLLSPLPYIGVRISVFCYLRAGKLSMTAYTPFNDARFVYEVLHGT